MLNAHGENPFQKRKITQPLSQNTIEKKRAVAQALHANGAFLNTHVKKEVLYEFVDLYDTFLRELFRSREYDREEFHVLWLHHYRIQSNDLDERSLESLIKDIKAGAGSMFYRRRAFDRLEMDFD
jgi:hypothetical protein